jgi:UDP:flavonoid glycosyltransferase YjiC (YdhE family)
MAHIHLCWELGGGLGHAVRLKGLARELQRRGHRVSLSLRELVHTHTVLADLDLPKLQVPTWQHRTEGLPAEQASMAEILLACGYLVPDALAGLVAGWRSIFGVLQPDYVVGDYAPTAVVAARTLGLRTAMLGIGFFMPPREMPLPSLRPWEAVPPARLEASEQRVLDSVNNVLGRHGAQAVRRVADILNGDLQVMCSWPELDHYERPAEALPRWYGPEDSAPNGVAPAWPAGVGPRVFCYLRSAQPGAHELLQALVDEGCVVLCYMLEIVAGRAPTVTHPALAYAAGPVALHEALPGCAFSVNYGNHATVAQSLMCGVPALMLPAQLEQFLMARRVERQGAGINASALARPVDWRGVVRRMRDDPALRAGAAVYKARYGAVRLDLRDALLADAIEADLENVTGLSPQGR